MSKPTLTQPRASQNPRSPWPCAPVIGGSWRAVPAKLRRAVLRALPPAADEPFDLGNEVTAMRCLRITALPAAYLVEALARRAQSGCGIFRFMLGPGLIVPLAGHGGSLARFVAATPPGRIGAEGGTQYARLFTSTLRGPDGRFEMVETVRDVLRTRPEAAALRAEWRRHLMPVVALGEDDKGRQGYEATIAYGEQLSWVRLAVKSSGEVIMEEDDMRAPLPAAPTETFAGAWQLFAAPARSPSPPATRR